MIVALFRRAIWYYMLLLLPYAVLVRLQGFLFAAPIRYSIKGPLYEIVDAFLYKHPLFSAIFATLLVFIQAVWLNKFFIVHRFTDRSTLLPGLFFIPLSSLTLEQLQAGPAAIGLIFVLYSLHYFFFIGEKFYTARYLFNSGFALAIAALFYPPYFHLLWWVPLGLLLLRNLRMKLFFQWLGGFVVVYYLIGVVAVVLQNPDLWKSSLPNAPGLEVFYSPIRPTDSYVLLLYIAVMGIFLLLFRRRKLRMVYKQRKKWTAFWWLMAFALLCFLSLSYFETQFFLLLAVFTASGLGLATVQMKNWTVVEIMHLALIVAVVYLQHIQLNA